MQLLIYIDNPSSTTFTALTPGTSSQSITSIPDDKVWSIYIQPAQAPFILT